MYFTCHPEDFEHSFDKISEDILNTQDCVIYYTPDMTFRIPEENGETILERMNLFVIPVSSCLLHTSNRAMDEDLRYAKEKHIPVLPIMQETGLDALYSQPDKFGNLQYLDAVSSDSTAISYEEKLEKYLSSVLFSEETIQKVRAAFDSYIFLSYRKTDRAYANELMRMIHKNPLCRSIAIWYDEFLTPGREFNEGIQEALKKSELFALLVTNNLLQQGNYVQRIEYPEARKTGKEIIPIDMESVYQERLEEEFAGDVPKCIDGKQPELFQAELFQTVRRLGLAKDEHDPAHSFLVGLAYLNGIDVEVDRERAVELITSAAEAELPEAMKKLKKMYEDAVGVACNYTEALKWAKRIAGCAAREYGEEHPDTLTTLNNLAFGYRELGKLQKALEISIKLYPICRRVLGEEHPLTQKSLGRMTEISEELSRRQLMETSLNGGK